MSDHDQKNPADQYHREAEPEPAQRVQRAAPNPPEDAEAMGTPDAIKESESRKAVKEKLAKVRGRGVDWVRPTDLLSQSGGACSRRGIDLTAAGNRRRRAPLDKGARWVAERVR